MDKLTLFLNGILVLVSLGMGYMASAESIDRKQNATGEFMKTRGPLFLSESVLDQ